MSYESDDDRGCLNLPLTGSCTASLLRKFSDNKSDAVLSKSMEEAISSAIVGRAHEEDAWGAFILLLGVERGGLSSTASAALGVLKISKHDLEMLLSPPADMM